MSRLIIGARSPLFFMHIPKTAGRSVRLFLENQYRAAEIFRGDAWEAIAGSAAELAAYRLVRGHFQINLKSALDPQAKVLTILREPLRRSVSALLHMQRDPNFHRLHALAKDLSLKEIIRNPRIMRAQHDIQSAYLCASTAPDELLSYLRRGGDGTRIPEPGDLERGPSVELAMRRLAEIDFVGTVEELGQLIAELSERMRYHPAAFFPVINDDPRGTDPFSDLDAEDLDILRACNRIDCEVYEGAKRLIAQRRFERTMRRLVSDGIYEVPAGSFDIDIGGVIPGSGWYGAERANGQVWRWTGPDRRFTVELPLRSNASYSVVLQYIAANPQANAGLSAEVNGEAVDVRSELSGTQFTASMTIPRHLLVRSGGLCRLVFDTQAVKPGDPAGGDIRKLGVAVNRVAFVCETA